MNIHEDPDEFDFAEPNADAEEQYPLLALSGVYLEAGLPLDAAAQAALADFESLFDEATLCAT